MSKNLIIVDLIGYAVAVLGGYLAVTLVNGRISVFLIQSTLMVYLGFLFLILLDNYYIDIEEEDKKDEPYIQSLTGGLGFVFLNPKVFFLSLGLVASLVVKSIWLSLLVFPIYFAYMGSDFYITILNLAIFFFTSLYALRRSNRWKDQNASKKLPLVKYLNGILFFVPLYALLSLLPPTGEIVYEAVAVLFVIGILSSVMLIQSKVLTYRVLLDIVPNDKRNGYYSFLPTFALVIAAVLNYFAGSYIQNNGYADIILGLAAIEVFGAILIGVVTIIFGIESITRTTLYDDDLPYIFDPDLHTELKSSVKSFRPSQWYLSETTRKIWETLMDVAKKDNKVTDDEMDLLIGGMKNMKSYLDNLENYLRDGIISDNEKKHLKKLRTEMLEKLTIAAKKDGKISKDEKRLIKAYEDILIELEKIEIIAEPSA